MALKIKGDNHSLLNFQRNLKLDIFSLAIRNDVLVVLRVEVLFYFQSDDEVVYIASCM